MFPPNNTPAGSTPPNPAQQQQTQTPDYLTKDEFNRTAAFIRGMNEKLETLTKSVPTMDAFVSMGLFEKADDGSYKVKAAPAPKPTQQQQQAADPEWKAEIDKLNTQLKQRDDALVAERRRAAETEQRSADLAAANADLEQRTAELTLINGVQQALASQLDLQAIFDLVGDKIRDIFDAQIVDIGIYDRDTGLLHFPYWIERGVRYPSEPIALFGIRKHVMETRQPLVINSDVMQDYASYGFPPMTWGEIPKSLVFVPLVVGDEAKGYISLQDLDREHAFSDSDVRLLSTLAASMSVALENARLFGETRRLLAETEQRAAELETVNRIGQALGAELELAALIELTGEQIRQTFAADIAYVALREGESNLILFPYYYEHGARSSDETMPYGQGLTSQIIMSGKPLLLNERIEAFEAQTGIQPIGPRPNRTSACRSWLASGRSA